MSKAVWFISYKLKKNASEDEFILASKECCKEVLAKQKGFISWKVLKQADTWVDLVEWESMEDATNAETAGANNSASQKFYSYLNMNSCKFDKYTIEKEH